MSPHIYFKVTRADGYPILSGGTEVSLIPHGQTFGPYEFDWVLEVLRDGKTNTIHVPAGQKMTWLPLPALEVYG